MNENDAPVVIIGAGYTGLSAAWELCNAGIPVEIFEAADEVGGLAGTFRWSNGVRVDRFYHHWFTSDGHILRLIHELGLDDLAVTLPSKTGLFYANSIFRLSSPLELLRFTAIPMVDRIRTGLMALYARRISNWRPLEGELAMDWIRRIGGDKAFEVIWRPLLQGKFGSEAVNVSAVWFWNKLKLRGGSRGEKGRENLLYFKGTFGALNDAFRSALESRGVRIRTSCAVTEIVSEEGIVRGVSTAQGFMPAKAVLATVPLPDFLRMTPSLPQSFRDNAAQVRFLGNACLTLRLSKSLSDTYWLNVADPTFPFVGVIEHTNLDPKENYEGDYIAYLSKYLPVTDELFAKSDEDYFAYCVPFIKRLFPDFSTDWVREFKVWRARYSQPVITKHYSSLIPENKTPITGLWLATMAQVYPEDRGTNYAVREGRRVGAMLCTALQRTSKEEH